MSLPIQRGLLVSTRVPAAAQAFAAGLERIAAADGDPRRAMQTALAADPNFILPQLAEIPDSGRREAIRSAAAETMLQPWERSHIELVLARPDQPDEEWALRTLAHVQRFPADAWMFARLFAFAFFDADAPLRALVNAQVGHAVRQFPGDDEYRCRWSRCLSEMGFPQRALRVLGTITQRRPDWPNAWHARVHALHGLARHEEAAEICAALRGRGGKFEAHLAWHEALVHLAAGRTERATQLFAECFGPTANEGVLPIAVADLAGFCWAYIAATGEAPPQPDALRDFHARARQHGGGSHVELQCALLGAAIAYAEGEASAELGEFATAVARRDWASVRHAVEAVCREKIDNCGGSRLQRAGVGLMWIVAASETGQRRDAILLPPQLESCAQHPVAARVLSEVDVAA